LYPQQRDESAKKRSSPVSFLSIPFQNNFEYGIKPNNGFKWTMNLQPIIPFSLTKDWNIINRFSLPVISQSNIFGNTSQTGIGDAVVNVLLSPKESAIIWGIGPAFYLPTGTSEFLTAKKWGIGPNILVIGQPGALTLGALYFHVWSFAGDEKRPILSFSYLQPFMTYALKEGWGLGIMSEMIDEMNSRMTNGSIIFTGSKMVSIGGQVIQFVFGPKLYFGNFNKPSFGVRATINIVFPD
jgi:hypothetical protein